MSASSRFASYFDNHRLGRTFPWSLYHAPIHREVSRFLSTLPGGARVLNVGCGPFADLDDLPPHVRYAGCDIDPRAIEACRARFGDRLECAVADPLALPFGDHAFDAIYATEVIEHCDRPELWLRELMRVTRKGGRILLTTPNYGSIMLPLLEQTALELVARVQGFSRKGIHPFRCTGPSLQALVRAVGGDAPAVREVSFGWVVVVEFGVPR